jgi:hypothetical protein
MCVSVFFVSEDHISQVETVMIGQVVTEINWKATFTKNISYREQALLDAYYYSIVFSLLV